MSSDEFEARKKAELTAIESLKFSFFIGFLVYILNLFLMGISQTAMISMKLENELSFAGADNNPISTYAFVAALLAVIYFFVLVYIVSMDRSVRRIIPIIKEFSIARIGIYLYGVGSFVYLPTIIFIYVFSSTTMVLTLMVELVGALLMFVGNGLIAAGLWRLSVSYKFSDLKLGAVLLLLIPILGFPLVYSELNGLKSKIRKRAPPPPAPPWIR